MDGGLHQPGREWISPGIGKGCGRPLAISLSRKICSLARAQEADAADQVCSESARTQKDGRESFALAGLATRTRYGRDAAHLVGELHSTGQPGLRRRKRQLRNCYASPQA